jgi:hypothetical protein
MKQFPRLVYKSESVHLLVKDQNELENTVEAGWFETVPEALQGVTTANDKLEVKAVVEKPAKTPKASAKTASTWGK